MAVIFSLFATVFATPCWPNDRLQVFGCFETPKLRPSLYTVNRQKSQLGGVVLRSGKVSSLIFQLLA